MRHPAGAAGQRLLVLVLVGDSLPFTPEFLFLETGSNPYKELLVGANETVGLHRDGTVTHLDITHATAATEKAAEAKGAMGDGRPLTYM